MLHTKQGLSFLYPVSQVNLGLKILVPSLPLDTCSSLSQSSYLPCITMFFRIQISVQVMSASTEKIVEERSVK